MVDNGSSVPPLPPLLVQNSLGILKCVQGWETLHPFQNFQGMLKPIQGKKTAAPDKKKPYEVPTTFNTFESQRIQYPKHNQKQGDTLA